MTIVVSITNEHPPTIPGVRSKDPKNESLRQLIEDLQVDGKWGKATGYTDKRSAQLAKRIAEGAAKKNGSRITTRVRKEDGGTWTLWVRKIPAKQD